MNFKKLILPLIMILLVSSVNASLVDDLNNNVYSYYKLENNVIDVVNGYNGTVNGATFLASAVIDGGYSYDGSNLDLTLPETNYDFERTDSFSVFAWIYIDADTGAYRYVYSKFNTGTYRGIIFDVLPDETLSVEFRNTISSNELIRSTTSTLPVGEWVHVGFSYDGSSSASGLTIYVNGVVSSSTVDADTLSATILNDITPVIGGSDLLTSNFDGDIDEFAWFDYEANVSVAEFLYNSDSPDSNQQYLFSSGTVSYFSITATNVNSDSLNIFNAAIDAVNYSTTNGTIITGILDNATSLYNITISAPDYFNKTYNNVNVSSNYVATGLYQSIVSFNATELYTDDVVEGYFSVRDDSTLDTVTTASIGGGKYNNYTGEFYLISGFNNFTIFKEFDPTGVSHEVAVTKSFNVTPLFSGNLTINDLPSSHINVSGLDVVSNNTLTNFTVNITNSLGDSNVYTYTSSPSCSYITTFLNNSNSSCSENEGLLIPTAQGLSYNLTFSQVSFSDGTLPSNSLSFGITNLEFNYYNVNLTSFNIVNNSLTNFTANVDDLNYSTTDGVLEFGLFNSSIVDSLVVTSSENGGYFNFTYNNLNLSSGFYNATGLYQAVVRVYATEVLTNNSITVFNVTDDFGVKEEAFKSVSPPNLWQYAEFNTIAGERTYTISKLPYYNTSQTFTVNAYDNTTSKTVLNVYDALLNVSTYSVLTGSTINNLTINVTELTNGYFTTNTTINGLSIVRLLQNYTYNLTMDPTGYEVKTINFTANATNVFNISFYTTNSLLITFKDSDTKALLNTTNITIQFIGTTAQTVTTSNATVYVDLLSPDSYTFLYEDDLDVYQTGKYLIDVSSRSFQNLTLYLQKKNNSQLILLTVSDKFGTELKDVEITVQKWSGDAWITDQIVETDFQGQTEAYYVLSTVYYNHVLELDGTVYSGVINDDADKKLIFAEDVSNGINFRIDILGGSDLINYLRIKEVSYTLNYTNLTNETGIFRYSWNDPDNSERLGCLKVYYTKNNSLYCSSCATSSLGTVFCNVASVNTTTYFTANALIDGQIIDSMIKYVGQKTRLNWGSTGYVIAFIIVLLSFIVFLNSPTISLFIGTGAFIGLSVMGLIFKDINFVVFIGLIVITYLIASIKSDSGVNG